jgi:hypothetical protein
LEHLWWAVKLRKRSGRPLPVSDERYCVNLIIDEAASLLQAELLHDAMIPKGREFGLAFEALVQFPEQIKRDALDTTPYKELLRNVNTKLLGKLAIDEELATTLFHEDLDAEALTNRIASLPRGEWLAQLPDTGFMTDTPELVTLKPLPIPPGHSEGESPVDAGTYSSTAEQTYQEADELQWSRTRFSYCLLPGVNCPPDAAQMKARWGHGVTNTEADFDEDGPGHGDGSGDSDHARAGGPSAGENDHSGADTRSGGASNEFGTVLGTGSTDDGQHRGRKTNATHEETSTAPPADELDENGDDSGNEPSSTGAGSITDDERTFLRTVIQALNGELEGYDLTQSMTALRNTAGSSVDVSKLEAAGYLEVQRVRGRKYYYVTPDGQAAVDRTVYRGRNAGDPYEKVRHKVYVEYLKRYIQNQGFVVETYYEPMGGGMIYDVAAFVERDDGTRRLRMVGEVLTNVRPELMVKHYDDMARNKGVLKLWVVQNYDVAHKLVRTLKQEGRVSDVPYKSINNYETISEETFGDLTEWRIIGATNLIDTVEERLADEDG